MLMTHKELTLESDDNLELWLRNGVLLTDSFDPETERHTGQFATEANELLKNANRPGFQVPDAGNV